MKAMVYRGNKNLNLEDVAEPVPEEDEVKLEVDYCGICATDIEEYLFGPVFIDHVTVSYTHLTLPTNSRV